MDKTCKYYKYQKYVSYDNGQTWSPLNEFQRGELIQFNSEDCGGGIGTLYKWEIITGDYECVGYDKYEKTQKYVSYDNGVTYSAVTPSEYGIGGLIQSNSEDCGYIPPQPTGTKWIAKYKSGYTESETATSPIETRSASCDRVPLRTIAEGEIPASLGTYSGTNRAYYIREAKIYDCVDWKIDDNAFGGLIYKYLTSVTLSNTVQWIGVNAFSNCISLNNVEIPSTVYRIDSQAFLYCESFTDMVIPDSVRIIAQSQDGSYEDRGGVFRGCSGLTSCTLSKNIAWIPTDMFRSCTSLSNVIIPNDNKITKIGNDAFYECSSLGSFNVPSGVTEIGDWVFAYCRSLTSISLPTNLTTIGFNSFYYCSNLSSINIPNSVVSIGGGAFSRCNLTSIRIPSGVTVIGNEAFRYNNGMTSVTVNAATPPTLGTNAFADTNDCPIYVPSASVDAYKSATNWSSYASRIQPMPNS